MPGSLTKLKQLSHSRVPRGPHKGLSPDVGPRNFSERRRPRAILSLRDLIEVACKPHLRPLPQMFPRNKMRLMQMALWTAQWLLMWQLITERWRLTTHDGSTKLRPRNDTFKSPRRIVGLAWNTEFFGDYVLFQCVGSVAGFSWTSMRSPGGAGGPGTALEAGADGNDGPGALLCVALASSFVMTSALVTQSSHWHRVWSVTPTSPSGQYILGDEPDQ